jgi:hypothetical protein
LSFLVRKDITITINACCANIDTKACWFTVLRITADVMRHDDVWWKKIELRGNTAAQMVSALVA